MSKLAREFEEAVTDAGFKPVRRTSNRHRKLECVHPATGEQRYTIILPTSPSDPMGLVNFKCYLKRLARRGPAPYGSRRG